jgi:TPR repeat protein
MRVWRGVQTAPSHRRYPAAMKKLLAALALAATVGCVQTPPLKAHPTSAAQRHAEGLALQTSGDEKAAFVAFLEAAQDGYSPAQLRVAEIYNDGNTAVVRDYATALQWFEKAREAGETIPPLHKPYGGGPPGGTGSWR